MSSFSSAHGYEKWYNNQTKLIDELNHKDNNNNVVRQNQVPHEQQIQQQGPLLYRYINGRKYIPILGECSTNIKNANAAAAEGAAEGTTKTAKYECDTIVASNTSHSGHHRCTGLYGGHPDLIAWDIIETLYSVL